LGRLLVMDSWSAENTVKDEFQALAAALANLVWPVDCAGCGSPDAALCPRCAGAFAGLPFAVHLPAATRSPGSPRVWGLAGYGGTAARLIVAWKDRGRADLSWPLGQALARAVDACREGAGWQGTGMEGEVWLVPMPARRAALRARGANLSLDLARAAARASGEGVRAAGVLRHVRTVRDQVGLDAADRVHNVSGSFGIRRRAGPSLNGRRCIVVDDIVTTGASVAEAVRVLTLGGSQVVGVCCLSVTFRRRGVLGEPERTSLSAWKAPSGP
jgi:predicted amidophosphoribosyltransferase